VLIDDGAADGVYRPAPLVSGEEGEELMKRIWNEIVDALEKDVPQVKEALRSLEGP
jgi:hypothetical protein